jgi:hypothetical protein
MITTYCEEILGIQVDLSSMLKGGIYYLKAEKTVQKIHEYRESVIAKQKDEFVKVGGGNSSVLENGGSILSTYAGDMEDETPEFHTYLIFIVHGSPLRR